MTDAVLNPSDPILRGPAVAGGPLDRPKPVTLEGRYVSLAPLDPGKDAADLYGPTHGPGKERRFAYLFDGPFDDEAAMEKNFAAAKSSDVNVTLAIRSPDGRTVGRATFMRVEPGHRTMEVGSILFSPTLARTPAATEAMYLMARHALETLGYRRYEWKCDSLNGPSRAAALRYGFTFEGIFRDHMIIKGHGRDTAWYAMSQRDWPVIKAAFEAWLDPVNFDADGRQKRALADIRASLEG